MRRLPLLIFALVILAAVAIVSAQDGAYTGQRWEYKYVTYVVGQASSGGLGAAVEQAAGSATATPSNPTDTINAELNVHGADGWELVSSDLLPGGAAPAFIWVFKRPIP